MDKDRSYVDQLLHECDRQTSQFTGKEMEFALKALDISRVIQYDIGVFESHFRIARSLMTGSNNEEAIEHLDICYSIAQTLGDVARVARTANSYGIAYYNLGITSKSLDHLLESLELSKAHNYVDIECRVYNNICSILTELCDFETALEYLYNILDKINKAGDSVFPKCIVYRNLAHTYYKMNKINEAEFYSKEALEEALREENPQMLCESHYILGQVRINQKQYDEGKNLMLKALVLAEKTYNDFYRVEIRIDLSKLYLKQDNPDEAYKIILDAYNMAMQMDFPVLKRRVASTMADVCLITGNNKMLIDALSKYKEITQMLEHENIRRQQVFTKAQLTLFKLKRDNERLRVEIERDPLTGCLSSRTFPDRIMQALSTYGNRGALVFLDIDNLKVVNDTYGHDTGDELLKSFAKDLLAVMPQEALKIRIAGDEFIVFMPRAGKAEATEYLDKLINTLSKPRKIGDIMMPVLLSAGIALYPDHSSDLNNLKKMADTAMYSAKKAGRGIYRVYSA